MLPTLRSAVRRKLLRWYESNKRDLPWRRAPDPYGVWIAETMLQQTQVKTVLPYYERFLQAFPTVEALARAPLERVLRHWSGLGYYRRAENLSKAARQIARRHNRNLPDDYEGLRQLPGIGDYTAGAVLSIAFGRRYPAVDGNARRVLSRLTRKSRERELRALAAALVPRTKPGQFNQALMELGATVCTPRNPRCGDCPLASRCKSGAKGAASMDPGKKSAPENMVWPLALVRRRGKILLQRRGTHGLLSGLWELPGRPLTTNEPVAVSPKKHFAELKMPRVSPVELGEIRHAITRWRIRAPVYLFDIDGTAPIERRRARRRWVSPAKIREQATSAMTVKAVALLSRHEEDSP
jgi:A/G-specific adenine glycosylase